MARPSSAVSPDRVLNPAPTRLSDEVLAGLRRTPKQLSPVWFYDELGSVLFDQICEVPEYYLTRTELAIMSTHAAEMGHHIGPHAALIEYGSGTSLKTRLLLDQLDMPRIYVPVDIARTHLLDAAGALARDYATLRIAPVCADFTQPFELPAHAAVADRRVVYFPGSTIGNFDPASARALLQSIRDLVGSQGAALIGVDLKKDREVLERAYNDAAGATAEFNLNALRHLNRELGTDFRLDGFEHEACWVEAQSRIEMHLVSREDQVVHLGEDEVHIARGERLLTECCHKYTLESFAELAGAAGFHVERVWTDAGEKFSVQLLEPRHLQ
jgi:L-histidine Nalpha-methyltransferase